VSSSESRWSDLRTAGLSCVQRQRGAESLTRCAKPWIMTAWPAKLSPRAGLRAILSFDAPAGAVDYEASPGPKVAKMSLGQPNPSAR
jgi:hypothetical protein